MPSNLSGNGILSTLCAGAGAVAVAAAAVAAAVAAAAVAAAVAAAAVAGAACTNALATLRASVSSVRSRQIAASAALRSSVTAFI